MRNIGDRVGAILGATGTEVEFFGYGVYEGDFIPVEAVGMLAEIGREIGMPNPRIKLDSGETVYGCECWWGDEEAVKERLRGKRVKMVSLSEIRKQMKG